MTLKFYSFKMITFLLFQIDHFLLFSASDFKILDLLI